VPLPRAPRALRSSSGQVIHVPGLTRRFRKAEREAVSREGAEVEISAQLKIGWEWLNKRNSERVPSSPSTKKVSGCDKARSIAATRVSS
jgi:hypothetical protein